MLKFSPDCTEPILNWMPLRTRLPKLTRMNSPGSISCTPQLVPAEFWQTPTPFSSPPSCLPKRKPGLPVLAVLNASSTIASPSGVELYVCVDPIPPPVGTSKFQVTVAASAAPAPSNTTSAIATTVASLFTAPSSSICDSFQPLRISKMSGGKIPENHLLGSL